MGEVRRHKGKIQSTRGFVHYRFEFKQSKAAYERLARIQFELDVQITSTYMPSICPGHRALAMLKMPYEHIEEVQRELAPSTIEFRYSSPTFFDNSQICPIYDSVTHEIDDQPCRRYVIFKQRTREAEREMDRLAQERWNQMNHTTVLDND